MALFRIHRMRESARQQFRWAPHASGVTVLKPRDFENTGEIEAGHHYDAWTQLRGSESALEVGDVLESESGDLRICKYVGFEEAKWAVIEAKAIPENGGTGETAPVLPG